MQSKKYLWVILAIALATLTLSGCGNSNKIITFSELISQADKYNSKTVTLEAFYFSGFEVSVLAGSVGPSSSGAWRIIPTGTMIWVEGGLSQEIIDKLGTQSNTPSGYLEHVGKLKVTGKFETGGKYGHLGAYQYQINITFTEILDWSPPPG